MAEAKRERKPRGFHALEKKKVHELEDADRTQVRRRDPRPDESAEGWCVVPERPPQAHEE
jgi:hypothetical protein